MERPKNLQCIRETRKTRFGNMLKNLSTKSVSKSASCGTVNPNTTLNIPLSGFGYLTVTCTNNDPIYPHSSYAAGYVSPTSVQVTVNSTSPFKTVPDINVFLSTTPVVQIGNRSSGVVDYSVTLDVC